MKFEILNEDCNVCIDKMIAEGKKVDVILTSPPYNTSRKSVLYDEYRDANPEYVDWITGLFKKFNEILSPNGVIIWNISYGNDSNAKCELSNTWLTIANIINETNFIVADKIVWKKKSALPISASSNKLTRIVEDVFIFCRKDEVYTFNCNKKIVSRSRTGQPYYENIYNLIEAANNDGSTELNKATYSSELCIKLLNLYAKEHAVVFDCFNGTGTTGVACKQLDMDYIGCEISKPQCEYSIKRINETKVFENFKIEDDAF